MVDELVLRGKTIKMTYAKLINIASIVGDLDQLNRVCFDPDLQTKVIKAFLAKYVTKDGVSYFDTDDLEFGFDTLLSEEALVIADFVEEQLDGFFMKALDMLKKKAESRQEREKANEKS